LSDLVAFTFEAGGDEGPVHGILGALRDSGARATFFLDGSWAESHPDLVRTIAADGHELANHGYAHPDWTTLADDEIEEDLAATERLVGELTGASSKPWARPPFGAIDERVRAVLERNGYTAFYRDAVDGAHWPGETTAESVAERALTAAAQEDVVVFHTNRVETERALGPLLDRLRRDGRRIVALSELGRPVTPRLERHPDFAELAVTPGYVRPTAPGGRWQSLNVLELGAAAVRAAASTERLVDLGDTVLDLLVGDDASALDARDEDRYVLLLAGAVRCDLPAGYLIARPGDLFLWPAGAAARLTSADGPPRRWLALVWSTS
jgi:peptidoglycan/xylan/chitin deacetylase (PgdA/CDA1 family)